MKKFLYKLSLMCLLVLVAIGAVVILNRQFFLNDSYLMEFPVKQQLITDTPSPKVVILGGSNVAFGLDCQTVSDSLHLPVINAGLHAGLGLRFIMDGNIPLVGKGDILVVMPEYDNFGGTAYGESQTSGMIPYFSSLSDMLQMNAAQWSNVIKGFGRVTLTSFVYGLTSMGEDGGQDRKTYQYKLDGFNSLGDEVSHWTLPSGVDMHTFVVGAIDNPLDTDFLQKFVSDLSEAERRGVRVVVLPPAIYDAGYKAKKPFIDSVSAYLMENGMPFQADTELFAYPADMMYNTEYHLNKAGVDANTQNVISALRRVLR